MQDFSKHYKTFTNIQLLEVLNHPDDYLEDAVKAALVELASRQVPEEDLAAANTFLEIKAEKKASKKVIFDLKSVYTLNSPDTLDASLVGLDGVGHQQNVDKLVLGVVIVSFLQSAYGLYEIFKFGIVDWSRYGVIISIVSGAIVLLMLVPTYLFLNGSRKGWSILTILYLSSLMVGVSDLLWRIGYRLDLIGDFGTISMYRASLVGIILGSVVLWALFRPILLQQYTVDISLKKKVIGWTVGVVGLYLLAKYYQILGTIYVQ